ncbi:uncharacterized protein [Oscarella lobularis]|uniref:uncharacterized protein isoform X2 n=1 Tax=Oscarella lobularis TaxID=121494 RepID=UPI0033139F10
MSVSKDPYVVVCCAEDTKEFAHKLCVALENENVRVFSSGKSILWGDSITKATADAIKACTHGIFIISRGFLKANQANVTYLENTVASALIMKTSRRPLDSNSSPFSLLPVCVKGRISVEEMRDAHPLLADHQPLEVDEDVGLEHGVRLVMTELTPRLSKLILIDKYSGYKSEMPSSAPAGSLPGEPACFFGRDLELGLVLDSISINFHLCCISGPPAVGKSALAIIAAHRARSGLFQNDRIKTPWNIVYIDVRQIVTPEEIVRALLNAFDLSYGNLQSSGKSNTTSLLMKVHALSNLCIIIDNADLALDSNHQAQFHELLVSIMDSAQEDLTVIVTSCYRLGRQFGSDRKVRNIELSQLAVEPAREMLRYCSPEFSDSDADVLARDVCQGLPGFLSHVRRGLGLSVADHVDALLLKPFDFFKKLPYDIMHRHFDKPVMSLARDQQSHLFALALFSGPFSKADGATVLGTDTRAFGTDVINYLDWFSLIEQVSENEEVYSLLRIFREFLREKIPLNLSFVLDAKERYCRLWLGKVLRILKNDYDRNPCKALRDLCEMIKEVKQAMKWVKTFAAKDEIYRLCLDVALSRKSMLRFCMTPYELKDFYTVCIEATSKRETNERDIIEGKLRIRLAEALLDGNDLIGAEMNLSSPEAKRVIEQSSSQWQIRRDIMRGRIDVESHQPEESRAAIQRLKSILKESGTNKIQDTHEYVDVCRVLADAYSDVEDYKTACAYLSDALAWCCKFFGKECNKYHPNTCALLSRLGHCYFCQTMYDKALKCHRLALKMSMDLQCDHLTVAAKWYQVGICRLGSSSEQNSLAQKELENAIILLEGETSFTTIPLWILAKQSIAKLLTFDGRDLLEEGRSTEGLALLEEAEKYFKSLPEEGVEKLPGDMAKENACFLFLLSDLRRHPGAAAAAAAAPSSMTADSLAAEIERLTLYCSPGLRDLAFNTLGHAEALHRPAYVDSPIDSLPSLDSRDWPLSTNRFDSTQHQTSTPVPVAGAFQRSQSYESSLMRSRSSSSSSFSVTPVLFRSLSRGSKTSLNLSCCPTNRSRRFFRCSTEGSFTSVSSFTPDFLSAGSDEGLEESSHQDDCGLVINANTSQAQHES